MRDLYNFNQVCQHFSRSVCPGLNSAQHELRTKIRLPGGLRTTESSRKIVKWLRGSPQRSSIYRCSLCAGNTLICPVCRKTATAVHCTERYPRFRTIIRCYCPESIKVSNLGLMNVGHDDLIKTAVDHGPFRSSKERQASHILSDTSVDGKKSSTVMVTTFLTQNDFKQSKAQTSKNTRLGPSP